jgi:CheY-like chemotaxis protein
MAQIVEQSSAEDAAKRVLVVEDDEEMRRIIVKQIRALGLETIEAGSGVAALAMLHQGLRADFLYTNVIMPGEIGGSELGRRAVALRPALKVVFASGLRRTAARGAGWLAENAGALSRAFAEKAAMPPGTRPADKARREPRGAPWPVAGR